MKRLFMILAAAFLLAGLNVQADADSENPTKWSQAPDWSRGYDILSYSSGPTVADDFLCEGGSIIDIHWWGSYAGDGDRDHPMGAPLTSFQIGFWTDVPKTGPNGNDYSHPGELIKTYDLDNLQGEYAGYQEWALHNGYQYNADISGTPFVQDQGTTYWISIAAKDNESWGWKTSSEHWNDDAAVYDPVDKIWEELRYPNGHPLAGDSIDMAFELTTPEPVSSALFLTGGAAILCYRRKRRGSISG
ncbi:MAG: hypothetical protein DRP85_00260 [Candidatus Makaraimicrobium thalassicum]|nr:MAG: hypothetical protein DRP85_00260 [Candidatus Omnitrophota bacterium]